MKLTLIKRIECEGNLIETISVVEWLPSSNDILPDFADDEVDRKFEEMSHDDYLRIPRTFFKASPIPKPMFTAAVDSIMRYANLDAVQEKRCVNVIDILIGMLLDRENYGSKILCDVGCTVEGLRRIREMMRDKECDRPFSKAAPAPPAATPEAPPSAG